MKDRNLVISAGTALAVALYLFLTHQGSVPLSYDFGGHLSRVYILIQDGIGWTDLWYNGYDLFHFYPPLYYLTVAPIAAVSFELLRPLSFGILGFTGFMSMYYYSSKKLEPWRARIASLLFMTGWLLYVAHVSGSVPQAFSASLAPLFFGLLEEALEDRSPVPAGVVAAFIVLLHHNSAVAVALGAILILLLNMDKNYLNAALSGLIAAGLSSFWLIPAALEYGNASYGAFHDLAGYGLESIVLVMPLYAAVILLKAFSSISSMHQYRQEAVIGLVGVFLSFGWFTSLTSHVPVVNSLPPYRFYILSAFSFSFLAAASKRRIAYIVMVACVVVSMFAVTQYDDRGLQEDQLSAYEYIEEKPEGLVYDGDFSDMRAFGLTLHEQRLAEGWSIGTTAIRPAISDFGKAVDRQDRQAAEFLRNMSVDYIITYNHSKRHRDLDKAVDLSEAFRRDRCFGTVCVYDSNHSNYPVKSKEGNTYTVNASKKLSIPYSDHFDDSARETEKGFTEVNGEGIKTFKYERKITHRASQLLSLVIILLSIAAYRDRWVLPRRYSKDCRTKLEHYVRDSGRRGS